MIDARMFTVGPVQENCFIVRTAGSDRAVIVDPGDESERLVEALGTFGITSVEAILLTHTHFDHVGAVAPVALATGAPVYCPELEKHVLADGGTLLRPLGDVIGHAESLTSPYHHELDPAWRCQTHSDWQPADMHLYRERLRPILRRHDIPLGPPVKLVNSGC